MTNLKINVFVVLLLSFFVFAGSAFAQSTNSTTQLSNNITTQMSLGSRVPSVCALQQFLINQNLLNIPKPTCYYGLLTAQAVRNFQGLNGLARVGNVGPATLRALNSTITTNTNTTTQTTPASNTSTSTTTNNQNSTSSNTTTNTSNTNTNTNTSTTTSTTPASNTSTSTTTASTPSNTPSIPNCALPALVVEYPNGGEQFTSGQTITAKWSSTCVTFFPTVSIFLEYNNPAVPNVLPTVTNLVFNTPNIGTANVILPNISDASQVGSYYKIIIVSASATIGNISDASDKEFSIY
ncbi:MAG: peptidoglycan-binding protein [bacterium]|nr:peptidoglycan-binding protein [bacterium]